MSLSRSFMKVRDPRGLGETKDVIEASAYVHEESHDGVISSHPEIV